MCDRIDGRAARDVASVGVRGQDRVMAPRRPVAAKQCSALPGLAVLLAGGVALEGCADDGAVRSERLRVHGERAARALEGSRSAEAMRELAVGLGLFAPAPESMVPPSGAVRAVTDYPPPPGAAPPVQTQPPVPPTEVGVDGGARRVEPTPPDAHLAPRPPAPHGRTRRGGAE